MTKAERSVSKQAHLQPCGHLIARSLSKQLENSHALLYTQKRLCANELLPPVEQTQTVKELLVQTPVFYNVWEAWEWH